MVILLHVVYVLVCLFLILVVLLQSGSGGGLGAGLGGASSASQQMFGGGFDSATVRTIPSGSFSAHDVRLEYDIPGRHGILVWLTDDPSNVRIFATDYHILPPMVP